MSELYFDLGGTKKVDGYQRVNLVGKAEIRADIMDLDSFCEDGTVDGFKLRHTLEHIPITRYRQFLLDMLRKLKPGGEVRVIQTDAEKVIHDYVAGKLSFRAMRCCLFTPACRVADNPLQQHQNMWGAGEMAMDFISVGYDEVGMYDAGFWRFDMHDEFARLDGDQGVKIANLGVVARRPR